MEEVPFTQRSRPSKQAEINLTLKETVEAMRAFSKKAGRKATTAEIREWMEEGRP